MASQIFKIPVTEEFLYELLEKIAEKIDNYYVVNYIAYKKMKFHGLQVEFLKTMEESYHYSKKFYAQRKFTYSSFINMIKQICRANNILYEMNAKKYLIYLQK